MLLCGSALRLRAAHETDPLAVVWLAVVTALPRLGLRSPVYSQLALIILLPLSTALFVSPGLIDRRSQRVGNEHLGVICRDQN